MTKIYTLTLAPSLDSATQTPQIYPEGSGNCSAPVMKIQASLQISQGQHFPSLDHRAMLK
ncbi:hypothetical protein KAM622c_20920 [Klebsiella quasipneumoniae subsp. quasipneumoniae]|nr:hypothetical protein KAM622c_20920 [Klebsiella quasipneumoniae subsp. quasipneumoniae]